ncbi:MAG: hypothetical protein HYU66_15730 [Armatimonadetes bacterium]|nr:hypothetical protein [Armatimonadota bacterium]
MRPRAWSLTFTASLGPLLLALVWFETQHAAQEGAADAPSASHPAPAVFENHLERIRNRSGEVTWQIDAARIEVLDSGDYLIQDLRHGQYLNHGLVEAHLRADRARFDARTHDLNAAGHLVIVSPRGLRFEADQAYWYEAEGKLVVPRVGRLEWRDPAHPKAPAGWLATARLFLWPRDGRLELPDPLTGAQARNRLEAAAAAGRLKEGRLQLKGPASLSVEADVPAAAGGAAQPKTVVIGVGAGGTIGYNQRTGGALLEREVAVALPQDRAVVRCDKAVWSGAEQGTVEASGNLFLSDPDNVVRAPGVTVDTGGRTARFAGPVELRHLDAGGQPTSLEAPGLTYTYAAGRRAARADGGVVVRFAEGTLRGRRVRVDLEAENAVVEGAVRLGARPRNPAPPGADRVAKARGEPVTVFCTRLRHRFAAGGRQSDAAGPVRFTQTHRHGSADRLVLDHEREELMLAGRVRLADDEGERAACQRLLYDWRNDTVTIETPAWAALWLDEER